MEWAILLLVVLALALLALYFYSRRAPRRTYPDRNPDPIADGEATRRGEYRVVPDPTKGDYTFAERDQHIEYDRIQERSAEMGAVDSLSRGNSVDASQR